MWCLQRLSHSLLLWFSSQSFEIGRTGSFYPHFQDKKTVKSSVLPKVRGVKNREGDNRPWCFLSSPSISSLVESESTSAHDYRQTSQGSVFLTQIHSLLATGLKNMTFWERATSSLVTWTGWKMTGPQVAFREVRVPRHSQPRSSCDYSCVPWVRGGVIIQERWKEGGGTDLINRSWRTGPAELRLIGAASP